MNLLGRLVVCKVKGLFQSYPRIYKKSPIIRHSMRMGKRRWAVKQTLPDSRKRMPTYPFIRMCSLRIWMTTMFNQEKYHATTLVLNNIGIIKSMQTLINTYFLFFRYHSSFILSSIANVRIVKWMLMKLTAKYHRRKKKLIIIYRNLRKANKSNSRKSRTMLLTWAVFVREDVIT